MLQRRHPQAMDVTGGFGRIIQRDHRVIVAAVLLRKGGGSDVSGERSDVPRTDAEDVSHGTEPSRHVRSRSLPLSQPGLLPMRAFIVEITAKLVVRSETDPEELPADIYSHIAEFLPSDDDILDLEVHAVPLPVDLSGSAPH